MDHLGDLVWSSSANNPATSNKNHLVNANPPTNSPQISLNKPSPTLARSNMHQHLIPNLPNKQQQQTQQQQQQPTPSYIVNSNNRRPMSPLTAQPPAASNSPTKPTDPFGNLLNFGSSSGKSSPSGSGMGKTLEEQRLAKEAELRKTRNDEMLKGFGNLAAMDITGSSGSSAGVSRSGSPSAANVLSANQHGRPLTSSSMPSSPNTHFFPQTYKAGSTPPPPSLASNAAASSSSAAAFALPKPVTSNRPQPEDAFSGLFNPTPMRTKLEKEKEKLDKMDGASLNQLRTKSPTPLIPSQSNGSPAQTSSRETGGGASPWDLDFLAAPKPIHATSAAIPADNEQVIDGGFDMGIFEKAVVDVAPEADATPTTRAIPTTTDGRQPSTIQTATTGTDHMVAQMVDMGYDVSEAQVALTASGGQSVQAAVELIAQQREHLQGSNPQRSRKQHPQQPQNESRTDLSHPSSPSSYPPTARRKFSYKDNDGHYREPSSPSSSPPLHRRQQPSQRNHDADPSSSSSSSDANLFNRDKLMAQANFITKSVFAKASTLVKQGQTKVKAAVNEVQHQLREYDEGGGRSRGGAGRDGRPRWMNEGAAPPQHEDDNDGTEYAVNGIFRDDDDDEGDGRGRRNRTQDQTSGKHGPSVVPQGSSSGGATSSSTATTRLKSQRRSQPSPPPTPARAVLPLRPVVACSPNAVQEMETHKAKGNEFYKLGQFGAADESYSVAISLLPAKHQLLIPLHSNRALARLKTGDHRGARDDATLALELIGEDHLRSADEIGPGGEGVAFADMYTKARIRRAQAFEGMEKYEEALKDYREVMAVSPGDRTVSVSMGRCQKAIRLAQESEGARSTKGNGEETGCGGGGGGGGGEAKKVVSAKDELLAMFEDASPATSGDPSRVPDSKPAPPGSDLDPFAMGGGDVGTSSPGGATKGYGRVTKQDIENSARVASMRAADAQIEQEDAERTLVKDSVDARINHWKGRKENNIRALLASLDTVLWPEMEWKTVGLHELVTPGNVKIKYVKAIGKVHPDKLNSVSAEQRLIAQGVFNALNEAWNAFKSQNNL